MEDPSSSSTEDHDHDSDQKSDTGSRRCQTRSSSKTTSIHVTALDGIVNVNSLFTAAVFIGLSFVKQGQQSLQNRPECNAGPDVARNLMVFEVISFAFFLFSSLVAKGLKMAINLLNSKDVDEAFRAEINSQVLRLGVVGSAGGSILGCVFLLLSLVELIQIRLGLLSCGHSSLAAHTVLALVVLVSSALGFYLSTVFYSFRK